MKKNYAIMKKDCKLLWVGTYSISNGLIHIDADYVEEAENVYGFFGSLREIRWQKTDSYVKKLSFPVADIHIIHELLPEKKLAEKTKLELKR